MVYDNAIEAGNKLIANVGKIRIYGKGRSHKMTRLLAPVDKGVSSITVETGLDWVAGDRIALAATGFIDDEGEDFVISSYDSATGVTALSGSTTHYHWGDPTSTVAEYGVDMRGEVILLSRSVKIQGENIESWGGQIVTSDTMEVFPTEVKMRYGSTILDNVELYNCS